MEKEDSQIQEEGESEEMEEITFSNVRPASDDEKKKFAAVLKEAKGPGEEIILPKFFDDGLVELVKYDFDDE